MTLNQYTTLLSGACSAMAEDLKRLPENTDKSAGDIIQTYMQKAGQTENRSWLIWNVSGKLYEAVIGPLSPDRSELPKDYMKAVSTVLDMLPPDDRELVLDRFGRGKTLQEVADENDCSREWVRQRLDAIVKKLKLPPYCSYLRHGCEYVAGMMQTREQNRQNAEEAALVENPANVPIDWMNLSSRASNVLRRAKLFTLKDILSYLNENKDFSALRGAGKAVTAEVMSRLEGLGITIHTN